MQQRVIAYRSKNRVITNVFKKIPKFKILDLILSFLTKKKKSLCECFEWNKILTAIAVLRV